MPTPSELRLVEPPAGTTPVVSAEHDLPAWSESAASSQGYAVPARFLWLADLFMLAVAAIVGHQAAPFVQGLVAPGAFLRHPWLDWLSLPSAQALGGFRPLSDVVWMPLIMIPATFLSMQVLGGYRQLLAQSRSRPDALSGLAASAAIRRRDGREHSKTDSFMRPMSRGLESRHAGSPQGHGRRSPASVHSHRPCAGR